MAKKRVLEILYPFAGKNRRWAFDKQPPATAYDMKNMRPDDSDSLRTRGATRPGMNKAYPSVTQADEVRLLSQVRAVASNLFGLWEDGFDQTAGGDLCAADPLWTLLPPNVFCPDIVGSKARAKPIAEITCGSVLDASANLDLDPAQQFSVSIKRTWEAIPGGHINTGKLWIVAGLDDANPVYALDSLAFIVDLVPLQPERVIWSLQNIQGGVTLPADIVTFNDPTFDTQAEFKMELRVNSAGTNIKGLVDGVVKVELTAATFPLIGKRMGLIFKRVNELATHEAEYFKVTYQKLGDAAEANRNYLVAGAGNRLHIEDEDGLDISVAATASLPVDIVTNPPAPYRTIQAVPYLGKLYIADFDEPRASGVDGAIDGGDANLFTSATYPNWASAGVDVDNDTIVLSQTDPPPSGTNEYDKTYKILSISGGNLFLEVDAAVGLGNIRFRIERAPKLYDPITDTLEILHVTPPSKASQVPAGNPLITVFQDALWFAGGRNNPHVWFKSAQGLFDDNDQPDFNYGLTDEGAAAAGNNSNAGLIGEPITAMIPTTEDFVLFGALGSTWIMRGDPTVGGRLDNLSRRVGIIGPDSWAYGPNSSVFFESRDGLYMVPPGAGGFPQSISEEVLPGELQNINTVTKHVVMQYDVVRRGLLIFVTTAGKTSGFWYDFEVPGFSPLEQASTPRSVFTSLRYEADSIANADVILGCRDGFLRRYSEGAVDDDGTPIKTFLTFGPFPVASQPHLDGVIQQLQLILGENSAPVTWEVYVGSTAEKCVKNYNAGKVAVTGVTRTSTNGQTLFSIHRPRRRGYAAMIKLRQISNQRWSFEKLIVVLMDRGRHRVEMT